MYNRNYNIMQFQWMNFFNELNSFKIIFKLSFQRNLLVFSFPSSYFNNTAQYFVTFLKFHVLWTEKFKLTNAFAEFYSLFSTFFIFLWLSRSYGMVRTCCLEFHAPIPWGIVVLIKKLIVGVNWIWWLRQNGFFVHTIQRHNFCDNWLRWCQKKSETKHKDPFKILDNNLAQHLFSPKNIPTTILIPTRLPQSMIADGFFTRQNRFPSNSITLHARNSKYPLI